MTNEEPSEKIERLWQNQPAEGAHISSEDLRRRMRKFERKIFWRNLREYVAGAIVIAGYAYYEWKLPALLLRIGSGLTIAGALLVMFQLHRRASAESPASDLGHSTYVEFHRRELVRQRDALRSVWSWYLLPFVPGLAVFLGGLTKTAVDAARLAGHPLSPFQIVEYVAISASFAILVFGGVLLLNRRSAARLQAQINDLEALTRDPE